MADLITSARAKYNINQATFTTAENTTLSALVTAASKAVKRFCRREFDTQSFDELYGGSGDVNLQLAQYPLLSVSRVSTAPAAVLLIRNTDASTLRAAVAVTSVGLTLVRVASGTTTTDTSVTWSGNSTLLAVKNAVVALGNGWTARQPDASYASWPSSDLRAPQGPLDAKQREAALRLHVQDIDDFHVDAPHGWLVRSAGWRRGVDNYRVVYSAGYDTVPEDVQEACAQWVSALYWETKNNPAAYPTLPPAGVVALLQPYRRQVIGT